MNHIWSSCVQFYKRTDRWLLFFCLACSVFSAFLLWGIYLSGYIKLRVFLVQLFATALGFFGACFLSGFDYRELAGLWKIYLPVAGGLVFLTYFIGKQRYSYIDDRHGSKSHFWG